ncbi:MAG: class I SAM-dependent methyltransferase [Thermodesulfobacteriota bacterium]
MNTLRLNRNRRDLAGLLRCPVTGQRLDYIPFNDGEGFGWPDGILMSEGGTWYPVIRGVPRLLSPALWGDYSAFCRRYEKEIGDAGVEGCGFESKRRWEGDGGDPDGLQTRHSFGIKWNSQPRWGLQGGSERQINEWVLKKYGWGDEEHYRKDIRRRRRILDAGTGLGREMLRFSRANPHALVLGMDLSDSVESAVLNLAGRPRTLVLQGDIMNPPFAPGSFDYIHSEGVLHHTPDTRSALMSLVRLLSKGGEIAFYIYRKKGPAREYCDDLLRDRIGALSPEAAFEEVKALTLLGRALSGVNQEIEVPEIPALGIPAGKTSVQRLLYWNFLKCFWNDDLTLEENNLVNFDWYHPRFAHRHTMAEVREWMEAACISPIWVNEEPAGITVRAVRNN